jgi:predicted nuclease of restriction endonuclease-like (RecB) superfamily
MTKPKRITKREMTIYDRIREILETARRNVARTVNTTQVVANWLIGREIVEEQQLGEKRAGYGENLIPTLSEQIANDFGRGYSVNNLKHFRAFYLAYPELLISPFSHAVRGESTRDELDGIAENTRRKSPSADLQPSIGHAARGQLGGQPKSDGSGIGHAARGQSTTLPTSGVPGIGDPLRHLASSLVGESAEFLHALRGESWQPGQLHPNLSWTHYRTLLRVDKVEARAFYEIEAIKNSWSARELERQINSLLYERLAKSKDKAGLMRLATAGQEIAAPIDVFKDPVVIEFLGLPESTKLAETELEEALINNLQAFLLELGNGFAYVDRQQRLTLDGDHFYIDLVFYHTVLKCFVLIDLKTGKLTHQDLGQLQLYVNYYDQERCTAGDNPTLGLILCTDKNDTVVRYTLGPQQSPKIFASRYKLYLPTEEELREEIRREMRGLPAPGAVRKQLRQRERKKPKK